jgi:hypothetical protein
MDTITVAVIWLLFGFVAAIIANAKGRGGCGWFLLGCLLGPFSLVVAFLQPASSLDEQKAREKGESRNFKRCPFCAEAVRKEAIKCKHCGSDLAVEEEERQPTKPPEQTMAYKLGMAWAKLKRRC